MAPGARNKFDAPMFELGLSEASLLLKKVLVSVTLLGLFGVPRSDSAPP